MQTEKENTDDLIAVALTLITGGFEAWLIERGQEHLLKCHCEHAAANQQELALLHKLALEYLTERLSELKNAPLWPESRYRAWASLELWKLSLGK